MRGDREPIMGVILTSLVMASSAAMMSTHLYTPSLPHFPGYFNTTPELAKLTLSLNARAIYGMVIALTPATAPIIGGYMHVWLGWRANFVFITVMGLLAFMFILRLLPESSVPDRNGMRPKLIFREYRQLLMNRDFMNYAIMTGSGSGTIMAFVTAGPFILISHLNVRTERHGFWRSPFWGCCSLPGLPIGWPRGGQ